MAYRSVGSLLPTSASSCGQPTADSCKSRWLWKRRRRGPSSGCFTRPILVVPPYVTSGASASGREALRADSDLRAYRPCHRKDGSAGTPERIHRRRYLRRAASLSGMATCVSRRGTCRVFALINRCFFYYQRITGSTRMVRAAAKEFNHNSRVSVSEALVRILKLGLQRLDVVPFVAPDSRQFITNKF